MVTISNRTLEFIQFLSEVEFFENKLWNENQKMYEDCGFEDAHTAYYNKKGA